MKVRLNLLKHHHWVANVMLMKYARSKQGMDGDIYIHNKYDIIDYAYITNIMWMTICS